MASKANFKTRILDYLAAHPNMDITRDFLIETFHISKGNLTDVLKSIKADGYSLITPPRSGLVRIELKEDESVLTTVTDKDLREWTILYLLSNHRELSFKELVKQTVLLKDASLFYIFSDFDSCKYDDQAIIDYINDRAPESETQLISVTTLRKDLNDLREKGLVKINNTGRFDQTTYSLSPNAPAIIQTTEKQLADFITDYEGQKTGWSNNQALVGIYEKALNAIDAIKSENPLKVTGHFNLFSPDQVQAFLRFTTLPYNEKVLLLHDHSDKEMFFATGLLFYSVQTDCFYALGLDAKSGGQTMIRLDTYKEIEAAKDINTEFKKPEYTEILDEMFAANFEKNPVRVKVLVANFANLKKRFEQLCHSRKNASLRPIASKPEDAAFCYDFVYEDTLRGLEDFARFLRSFGYGVLAVEPPALVKRMEASAIKKIAAYEEFENGK